MTKTAKDVKKSTPEKNPHSEMNWGKSEGKEFPKEDAVDNTEPTSSVDNFPRMSPDQYYKYRWNLSEAELAKARLEQKRTKRLLLQKNIEILQLQLRLFSVIDFKVVEGEAKAKTHEYNLYVHELEKELGISLKDKLVDDITFEIKEAPAE